MRIKIATSRGTAVVFAGKTVQHLTDHRGRKHPVAKVEVQNFSPCKRVVFERDGKLYSYPVLTVSAR